MNSQQVDDRLLALLKDLPYFSRLGTSLSISLADHAAQLCGCRSSRQVDDNRSDDVSDQFDDLINNLHSHIHECILYIENDHIYKQSIFEMDDSELEILLENTLYEMVCLDCRHIFADNFLINE